MAERGVSSVLVFIAGVGTFDVIMSVSAFVRWAVNQ